MKKTKDKRMQKRKRGNREQRRGSRRLWNSLLPSRKYFWITFRKKVLCYPDKQLDPCVFSWEAHLHECQDTSGNDQLLFNCTMQIPPWAPCCMSKYCNHEGTNVDFDRFVRFKYPRIQKSGFWNVVFLGVCIYCDVCCVLEQLASVCHVLDISLF